MKMPNSWFKNLKHVQVCVDNNGKASLVDILMYNDNNGRLKPNASSNALTTEQRVSTHDSAHKAKKELRPIQSKSHTQVGKLSELQGEGDVTD